MKIWGWAAVLGCFAGPLWAECSETRVSLRGDWGTASFSVEIADDNAERALGLMHREYMPKSHGMLFVYEQEQPRVSFWMRNTLIPLDLLYIDTAGVVQEIHTAKPLDETAIPSSGPRLAVLEINGGLADAMGISVGSQVRHPAFGDDAAWACDTK
ncbi:DUF192 domain-containing protein [Donghicola eburneus]|jgi:uncharacterized membrane protein (UPF0127 family)|uniref:Uncharacterized protein n=1 Tax=Donghicola eburneus TaxID=393278 RepID=A0A1M4N0M1_9RHOB|nr:DUF192 domain-containing protein [Donghicola eburneus]MCI5041751.1 DUF192 domain-containing protein [Donghicola eburneus]SCM68410.1 hypothetical protein KARMA_2629 [Donghicola eburneus]SFQ23636.1 hypothetical protein SAMN05421764_102228 [Donghicola eburneus]